MGFQPTRVAYSFLALVLALFAVLWVLVSLVVCLIFPSGGMGIGKIGFATGTRIGFRNFQPFFSLAVDLQVSQLVSCVCF